MGETCPQRVQTRRGGEVHPQIFSLLMLPWLQGIWDPSPICTCIFHPWRLLAVACCFPSREPPSKIRSSLLFFKPDGQPKKVRKVPPGLPSSVSGRSVFPAGIPSPFLHPLGIPAPFATRAAAPTGPAIPNIEGLDFSRTRKGFPSYSFLCRRNGEAL